MEDRKPPPPPEPPPKRVIREGHIPKPPPTRKIRENDPKDLYMFGLSVVLFILGGIWGWFSRG